MVAKNLEYYLFTMSCEFGSWPLSYCIFPLLYYILLLLKLHGMIFELIKGQRVDKRKP